MSILATAGRARIYNTDGTGRDTYIGFNNGGNTAAYFPTKSFQAGTLKGVTRSFKVGGTSPVKTLHYQVDGSGRDSYIHATDGGFTTQYGRMNDRDAYVNSLRGYGTNPAHMQRTLYK